KNLATYSSALTSSTLSRRFTANLRKDGLRLLLDVDLDYYSKVKVGDLINHLNVEANRTTIAIRTLTRIAISAITILVFLGILVSISWQLTIVSTGLLGVVALVNQFAVRQARSFGELLSKLSRAYSSRIVEILSGIRLVKATGNENFEFNIVEGLIRDREKAEFKSQAVFASIAPLNEMLSILSLIGIVLMGRLLFANQLQELASSMLLYLVFLFRMLPHIGQLNTNRSQFANTAASVRIISDFLRYENKPFMSPGSHSFSELKEGIRFKQISFNYPGNGQKVLENVDLYLPKGTTLALVGASGAGKSTMADLLPRFYDPVEGCIEIDGIDLRQFNIISFRKRLGVVSQDTFLFNASIRDNLKYGRSNATDEEVIDAAKRANAHEFITRLPDGFETQIGDRGVLLSGGQRQRLAIARALLQDPEILILDEATSALDTISERLVQKAIDDLSRDRTTLVIAHRLSTIQKADQIAVLERGKVVEIGTHLELLKKGEYYARLYAMQFSDTLKENRAITESKHFRDKAIIRTSYEARSYLNTMIGFLGFLTDGTFDTTGEQEELAKLAYESALDLLRVLESLEQAAQDRARLKS
ncbi:MAG: ABC transporter ATP-binding protein, partial [Leptolyngbyaceae cyanobacterium MO_188.B28]|nr:ABC transporter ATP-binding protein [Leptolyngbyaceae cyanobacterium MO_188.B28]